MSSQYHINNNSLNFVPWSNSTPLPVALNSHDDSIRAGLLRIGFNTLQSIWALQRCLLFERDHPDRINSITLSVARYVYQAGGIPNRAMAMIVHRSAGAFSLWRRGKTASTHITDALRNAFMMALDIIEVALKYYFHHQQLTSLIQQFPTATQSELDDSLSEWEQSLEHENLRPIREHINIITQRLRDARSMPPARSASVRSSDGDSEDSHITNLTTIRNRFGLEDLTSSNDVIEVKMDSEDQAQTLNSLQSVQDAESESDVESASDLQQPLMENFSYFSIDPQLPPPPPPPPPVDPPPMSSSSGSLFSSSTTSKSSAANTAFASTHAQNQPLPPHSMFLHLSMLLTSHKSMARMS